MRIVAIPGNRNAFRALVLTMPFDRAFAAPAASPVGILLRSSNTATVLLRSTNTATIVLRSTNTEAG